MILYLDFETRSQVDLKRVGLHRYAHDLTTEVVITGWATDTSEVQVDDGFPPLVRVLLDKPDTILVAHNAAFEREVIFAKGNVLVPWERIIDTAALAARMSLPRKLEAVALALHLDEQKDMAGHRIMLKLARPKGGWEDDEFWEEEEKPTDFAALREYCRQDVAVMREVHRGLLPLEPGEARLYALTGRMNDAGVQVDVESIPPALALLERSSAAEAAEFRALSGGHGVKSYRNVAKALGLPNVKKPTVRNALRDPTLDPRRHRALVLFQRLAKSSPAKLRAYLNRVSADNRLRGSMIYSGAERTQRWSSGGVQLHNQPRGLGEGTEAAFEALHAGVLDLLYDEPVGTVAEMLRGFIVGPLFVGDFAQIEARTLNWFAGQEDMLSLFRTKGDPYCAMASKIYGRPITKKDTDPRLPPGITPRFIGKQSVLGAGYGMGWDKFRRSLDEVFDVPISEDFAMRVIATYRNSSPRVVALWDRLESAFKYVVSSNVAFHRVDPRIAMGNTKVGGIRYAFIELPSKRRLYYAEPEMSAEGPRYWGRSIYLGGKWDRVHTYGGKLAENVVQATARDVMGDAMLRLDAAGWRILITVHDEIVADSKGLLSDFHDVMTQTPKWAEGLPIEVETFESHRYRK